MAQVAAMASAVPNRYRALIVFAAGMALRPGEAFGLTVDRIDFLRRSVRVAQLLRGALGSRQLCALPGYRKRRSTHQGLVDDAVALG